jgi:hypothetical protein
MRRSVVVVRVLLGKDTVMMRDPESIESGEDQALFAGIVLVALFLASIAAIALIYLR